MNNLQLERLINQKLDISNYKDYAPNGLQVEGRREVQRVVTGVTASQDLLDAAIAVEADAVLVHHGYFWKDEPAEIRGMKRNRLKTLLATDTNMYAYHLPLDGHPELGNNAQLAKLFGINVQGEIAVLLLWGELEKPLTGEEFRQRIEVTLDRNVLHSSQNAPAEIRRVAWCSGGGQGYIQKAAEYGVDAFISGEVSEQTIHIAREMGLHFYAAGHHATERYGVKALGEWLAAEHGLDVMFIDIDNPA